MNARWNQLSITSETCTGKTTLLRNLAGRFVGELPYRFISGGAIMRVKAESLGMSIEQFAEHNRFYPDEGHDKACDQMISAFAEHDFVIGDGRLVHFFMPRAFHVFLTCDLRIRARRRKLQEKFAHLSEAQIMRDICKRDHDDSTRYQMLYGTECLWAPPRYDLHVDTTEIGADEVFARVLEGYEAWRTQPVPV